MHTRPVICSALTYYGNKLGQEKKTNGSTTEHRPKTGHDIKRASGLSVLPVVLPCFEKFSGFKGASIRFSHVKGRLNCNLRVLFDAKTCAVKTQGPGLSSIQFRHADTKRHKPRHKTQNKLFGQYLGCLVSWSCKSSPLFLG